MALEGGSEDDMYNAVVQVAGNCMLTKDNIEEFSVFDMDYFFLHLRARSIGEATTLNFTCNNIVDDVVCDNKISVEYKILDTKVIKPEGHSKKIQLSDDVGVMMRYPHLKDRGLKDRTLTTEEAFDLIYRCIDYIYTKDTIHYAKDASKQELADFVESLPETAFTKINNFFQSMPYIQSTLKFQCPKCKYEHETDLEGLTNFFD